MPQQETITVGVMDGQAATQAEDAFRRVYAEAFAEPPYEETAEEVAASFRRFRSQARRAAFRSVLARTDDGDPVGMAYGFPLEATTEWWDQLIEPVSEDMRREDGYRTFGLIELTVRASWRRQGVARRLHDVLVGGVDAERVLLNVHPGNEAAVAAYRVWGYEKVSEARPWEGADVHDVMLLVLR